MRINWLRLKNFRNFEEETFYFPENFTVLIGPNGSGKSSILSSLRLSISSFFAGVPSIKFPQEKSKPNFRLYNEGKHLKYELPCEVEVEGEFPNSKEKVVWKRCQLPPYSNEPISDDFENIKAIGSELLTSLKNEEQKNTLPLVAYFGTLRYASPAPSKFAIRDSDVKEYTIEDGYENWSNLRTSYFGYKTWIVNLSKAIQHGFETNNSIDAFFNAFQSALPYLEATDINLGSLYTKFKFDGRETPLIYIEYQSDGIRGFAEVVAEIAYRCIILNGHKGIDAVKETHGIVMIDELDLHLHPNWQKHVVADLCRAFPNIQFVATTHSPIIVQSLKAEQVINLDKLGEKMEQDPEDMTLAEVAEDVMGLKGIRSDDFESRYQSAKQELEAIQAKEGKLKLEDYQRISDLLADVQRYETNDPARKAFLDLTQPED